MKFVKALWLVLVVGIWMLASYFYHPSIEVAAVSGTLGLALAGLASWSASRFGFSTKGIAKLLVVSTVASFMFSQALDVIYVLFSAPAGGRFDTAPEIAAFAALLGISSLLVARFVFRPNQNQDSNS